ncbi:MAG: SDR family NAD(P)-dependent oxidoreductase [Alphaproteobacteria bacterium]|nr:SDR family NAD(P)-dependent oxidoreductase [Alphaproteobacteria bacterium]
MAKSQQRRFADFQVGDYAIFTQKFTRADFKAFAKLSGDQNPLHGDDRYAAQSKFKRPIVPVHMSMSPLSMIAGMLMPGRPSLYLGHEVRALKPVFFDEDITYSARIAVIQEAERILQIEVIAFRREKPEVVLQASMRVQSREEEWMQDAGPIKLAPRSLAALVTGANGAIGSAVARRLADEGWDLILHHRGPVSVITEVSDACQLKGVNVTTCSADLATRAGQTKVEKLLAGRTDVVALIHTASAPVLAGIDQHVPVSYGAMKSLVNGALAGMLGRQCGRIVAIGSTAMHQPPVGWEDYAAAKGMTTSYLSGLDKSLSAFGVRAVTVAPTYVLSSYSDSVRPEGVAALLPEEVAEQVVSIAQAREVEAPYVMMGVNSTCHGTYGFQLRDSSITVSQSVSRKDAAVMVGDELPLTQGIGQGIGLPDFVRAFLKLPADYDLSGAALGETPGWDSLRHLELVLAIEEKFGVAFSSADIESTHAYVTLAEMVREKSGLSF